MTLDRIGRVLVALALAASAPATASTAGAARPAPPASAAQKAVDAELDAALTAIMADAEVARGHAERARALAAAIPDLRARTLAIAKADWLRGEALIGANRLAAAEPVVQAALASVARTAPATKLHGDLMRSRGGIYAMTGRVQPALADFQRAHDIFRAAGERRSQAMALQDIGAIYVDAGDYPRVLRYYAQAAEVYDDDPAVTISTHNNRAVALRHLGRIAEAEAEYGRALVLARRIGSAALEARILTNMAAIEVAQGKLAAADANIARGLALTGDGAAEAWKPFLWGVAAQAAEKRGATQRAEALLQRVFGGRDLATTTQPFRDFHETAYRVYAQLGDDARALQHFEAVHRIDDEAMKLASTTNAALMAARFDFANQDLAIARLKAGQIARDAALAASRARLQRTVLVGLLAAAAVLAILSTFGFLSIRRSRNATRAANAQLSETNVALETALRAKTAFLATTSHEIRTPLNGILGMTQVLLADRRLGADLRERIELVHGAGETMRSLVDDILDAAKMETGHLTVHREEMDLHRLLEEAARLWRGQAEAKGIALTLDFGDAPTRIREDETRLRQILFNLMSNALKFTDAGAVSIAAAVNGERLAIRVTDSGTGIPEDQFEAIFDSFHQVDGGITRRFGGTGLGLTISRNLARAMGGEVHVESRLGEGSTFTLDLPMEALAARTPEADATARPVPTTLDACTVLLIEGNPLTRSILRAVLAPAVFSVEVASSRSEAAALLAERRIDRIVADAGSLEQPEDDPVGGVRALVAAAGAVPVSLLWPSPSDEDREALAGCGTAQVLAKPIAGAALVAALAAACAGTYIEARVAA